VKITRDILEEIALQESQNVERWISSSVCKARISQFNKLRQRELAMFLDCPSVYAHSDPVANEGLNYQNMPAEERVGDVFRILSGSSVLHNSRHLSVLLIHPKTLRPIYNFVDVVKIANVQIGNARTLQGYLNIASSFASRYADEFLWVRRLLVHRALLAQEAVRAVVGNCEYLELKRTSDHAPSVALPITSWATGGSWRSSGNYGYIARIPVSNIFSVGNLGELEFVVCRFNISSPDPVIDDLDLIYSCEL
jgi:hypothetical protein